MQFWTSFSIFSWHSLLALLGLLFGLLSALSLATWSASRLWKLKPAVTMSGYVIWRWLQGVALWSRRVAFAAGFMVAGIAADQLWTFHHSETLADVYVLQKLDDQNYRLQTDKGQAFEVTMCDDSKVDWRAGERLKVLNYEQRRGCKSIIGKNLGYIKGE